MPLNVRQELHMRRILDQAACAIAHKYARGAEEHTGAGEPELEDLPADQLLNAAIDEAVDQLVYLLSLKDKLIWQK